MSTGLPPVIGDMRTARPILTIGVSGLVAMAVVVAAGSYPTYRLAGTEGLRSMAAAAALSLVALLIGLLPIAWAWNSPPPERLKAMLISMAVRLAVVLVLSLAVVFSGWLHPAALLIWVAISYIAGLGGESAMLALTTHRSQRTPE